MRAQEDAQDGAGAGGPRPDVALLRSDNNFRHDCDTYTENIRLGKHDEQWLHEAWVAHAKRRRGDFDAFEVARFERNWGVKLPPEHYPKRPRLEGAAAEGRVATTTPEPLAVDETLALAERPEVQGKRRAGPASSPVPARSRRRPRFAAHRGLEDG